jgi:hypothetical protein
MMRSLLLFAAVCGLLAGCATPPPAPEAEKPPAAEVVDAARGPEPQQPPMTPIVIVPRTDDAAVALAYFDRVRRMPQAELARELEATRTTYGRTHADTDRVRLAMLLALPNSAVTDDARALDLLEPIVKTPAHGLHYVAVLLSTYVQEQRRLALSAQALQKDVQTLQQKLDALRSLERALSEREGVPPRRR